MQTYVAKYMLPLCYWSRNKLYHKMVPFDVKNEFKKNTRSNLQEMLFVSSVYRLSRPALVFQSAVIPAVW